jgi:hypothetical protein
VYEEVQWLATAPCFVAMLRTTHLSSGQREQARTRAARVLADTDLYRAAYGEFMIETSMQQQG